MAIPEPNSDSSSTPHQKNPTEPSSSSTTNPASAEGSSTSLPIGTSSDAQSSNLNLGSNPNKNNSSLNNPSPNPSLTTPSLNNSSPTLTSPNPSGATASPQPNSSQLNSSKPPPADSPNLSSSIPTLSLSPTPSLSPSPSPNSSANSSNINSLNPITTTTKSENTPTPNIAPVINTNTTINTPAGGISTITTTISAPVGAPTSHRNPPPPPPPTISPPSDNSGGGGLSGGAITGIAVVAGILGFVLLFWVGVQILQSKRRRREEAEMQEIDFDPTGNSVNGDLPFPRASGALERGPTSLSGSNSLGYRKAGLGAHYSGAAYGDELVAHSDSEFVDGAIQADFESGLNRKTTLGASSVYTNGSGQSFYPSSSSRPPAPYSNYAFYPAQYGVPPSNRYEAPSGLNYDYTTAGHYAGSNPAPNSEYHR